MRVASSSVSTAAARHARARQAVAQPLAVLRRLQLAHQPDADVGQALVVEVHRVLGGQHDPHALGPRLLEQREERPLGAAGWRDGAGSSRRSRPCRRARGAAWCRPGAASRSSPCPAGARSRRAAPRRRGARWRRSRAAAGRPGARSMRSMSRGSPSRQASKDGEASRLLRAIISACAVLARVDASRGAGRRASRRAGRPRPGSAPPGSGPCPARQARLDEGAEEDRLRATAAGRPRCRRRPRSPATMPAISSRRSSSCGVERARRAPPATAACPGARPAREPGRVDDRLVAPAGARRRRPRPGPTSARPFVHCGRGLRSGLLRRLALAPRRLGVDPGRELRGVEAVEEQEEVAEVALGVDGEHRDRPAGAPPR